MKKIGMANHSSNNFTHNMTLSSFITGAVKKHLHSKWVAGLEPVRRHFLGSAVVQIHYIPSSAAVEEGALECVTYKVVVCLHYAASETRRGSPVLQRIATSSVVGLQMQYCSSWTVNHWGHELSWEPSKPLADGWE
jgi:hypothetical protein